MSSYGEQLKVTLKKEGKYKKGEGKIVTKLVARWEEGGWLPKAGPPSKLELDKILADCKERHCRAVKNEQEEEKERRGRFAAKPMKAGKARQDVETTVANTIVAKMWRDRQGQGKEEELTPEAQPLPEKTASLYPTLQQPPTAPPPPYVTNTNPFAPPPAIQASLMGATVKRVLLDVDDGGMQDQMLEVLENIEDRLKHLEEQLRLTQRTPASAASFSSFIPGPHSTPHNNPLPPKPQQLNEQHFLVPEEPPRHSSMFPLLPDTQDLLAALTQQLYVAPQFPPVQQQKNWTQQRPWQPRGRGGPTSFYCYNCGQPGHYSRECLEPRHSGTRPPLEDSPTPALAPLPTVPPTPQVTIPLQLFMALQQPQQKQQQWQQRWQPNGRETGSRGNTGRGFRGNRGRGGASAPALYCYNCGRPGHFARHCPMLNQPGNQQQQTAAVGPLPPQPSGPQDPPSMQALQQYYQQQQ